MLSKKLSKNSLVDSITVGARASKLSQAQVCEVLQLLNQFYSEIAFEVLLVDTSGDKDLNTSLRTMDKTDFFTREIDDLILKGMCRVGIHSAKDLPDPLRTGLKRIALTKGIDPSDVLVLRPGEQVNTLPPGSLIATSSERREAQVKALRSDFCFKDIRGTIEQRLSQLDSKKVDGVVIAEAALIRLGLIDLNRIKLPGTTALFQGQLAVVALQDDVEMQTLFACIDGK